MLEQHFKKNGKPVELTAADYAKKAGITPSQATYILTQAKKDGILEADKVDNISIYRVAK